MAEIWKKKSYLLLQEQILVALLLPILEENLSDFILVILINTKLHYWNIYFMKQSIYFLNVAKIWCIIQVTSLVYFFINYFFFLKHSLSVIIRIIGTEYIFSLRQHLHINMIFNNTNKLFHLQKKTSKIAYCENINLFSALLYSNNLI